MADLKEYLKAPIRKYSRRHDDVLLSPGGMRIHRLQTTVKFGLGMLIMGIAASVFYYSESYYSSPAACGDPLINHTVAATRLTAAGVQWAWAMLFFISFGLSSVHLVHMEQHSTSLKQRTTMVHHCIHTLVTQTPAHRAVLQWASSALGANSGSKCHQVQKCRNLQTNGLRLVPPLGNLLK